MKFFMQCWVSRNIINRKIEEGSYFEEALLDYFCPYGIISEKIGLIKRSTLKDYHQHNIKSRPYSAKISGVPLPIIKDYYKNINNSTIWEFLNDKNFDSLLNRNEIKKLSGP